ncbi:DUF805 domain-containing protein, partial [Klebsiella pneumoniae]|uniref:DUF805 domain-containing protein n=1 Tax=Klebsiella pneumoniae TaxID=573 RepID=UPI003C925676
FLPWWAVQFRRLHDTDRSAWWPLLLLIQVIGWLVILIFNCQRGPEGNNRFGPDPTQSGAENQHRATLLDQPERL